MSVYLLLVLVLVNGEPTLKGGLYQTEAMCAMARAHALTQADVQGATTCRPLLIEPEHFTR